VTLSGRDFLKEADFTTAELDELLALAAQLKAERRAGAERKRLVGRQIALIFEKTSTRTRVSFEVAIRDQGGHATVLDPASSQIGHKESPADTARVLARMFDAIEFRGASQETAEELAHYADVPVYNGLTDEWHPTQMLADFLTMREHSADPATPPTYAYLGDARSNMGNSLLVMGAIMGADVRIVAPKALWPTVDVRNLAADRAAQTGATIRLTEDPDEGLAGAQFVHTDVWVSMGEPKEAWAARVELLQPYRVDATMMARAAKDARFMHCLPAYHDQKTAIGRSLAADFGMRDGVEVSNEVFESPASIVFDQAENRMHTIKAILVATLA
jgi:ornithine carbamoyltransferase